MIPYLNAHLIFTFSVLLGAVLRHDLLGLKKSIYRLEVTDKYSTKNNIE